MMKVLTPANDLQNAFLYILLILLCCYFVCAFFYSVQGRMYSNMAIAFIALVLALIPNNRMKMMMRETCVLHLPAWCWYAYVIFLLAVAIWISLSNRDFRKNRITPMTIKDCSDQLPAGICFWKKGGRVILANQKMQQLCYTITGNHLMNGEEFLSALPKQQIHLKDGSVWHFQHQEVIQRGIVYSELIATDITELVQETKELESKTEALRKMNESLHQYQGSIEEIVKEKEILKARVNIHDEMNRLMLTTERTINAGDPASRKEMLTKWKECALFLGNETTQDAENNLLRDLSTYGSLMGIEFVCDGIPAIRNREIRRLLARSAREAMGNAVKHGYASHLYAVIRKEEDMVYCEFTDDGHSVANKTDKAGGLRTMEEQVAELGGKFSVEQTDGFKVMIQVPDQL